MRSKTRAVKESKQKTNRRENSKIFIFQPFDVEKELVNMLVMEGVIETNPDDTDQVKLVDFVN